MTPEQIEQTVRRSLASIAPEADLGSLGRADDLRDALDIDSMDFLRFVVALHDALHVDIPERDYAKIRTLDACVGYLSSRLGSPAGHAAPPRSG